MLAQYLAVTGVVASILYLLYGYLQSPRPTQKPLAISKIYIYPIKGLRPTEPEEALATKYGFQHDRRYMLLKCLPKGEFENMHVGHKPAMSLFMTSITLGNEEEDGGIITVTYHPVQQDSVKNSDPKEDTLEVPLRPSTEDLAKIRVNMHGSATDAHRMPDRYSAWFSARFGYDVVLAYVGANRRSVMFQDAQFQKPAASSAMPSTSLLSKLTSTLRGTKSTGPAGPSPLLTFTDCAPFLLASSTSLSDISARFPPTNPMDITKFRPNLVVSGAPLPWEEDYWATVRIGSGYAAPQPPLPMTSASTEKASRARTSEERKRGKAGLTLHLAHNCIRCRSVDIDYATGRFGDPRVAGGPGQVLKKLQVDRRVDPGKRWSPVFGRYGFVVGDGDGDGDGEADTKSDKGHVVRVGDAVTILTRQRERSVWNWPGL